MIVTDSVYSVLVCASLVDVSECYSDMVSVIQWVVLWHLSLARHGFIGLLWDWEYCRISHPMAERLNLRSFVLLYFVLFAFLSCI